jgi:hypothetical protein
MASVGFALPILPGKTEAARTFQRALDGSRKGEYGESERNIGITKELWFLQQTPNGDLFVAYLESADPDRALGMFSQSREPFEVWFKEQLAIITGMDMNNPPPGPLSELLSHYEG